MEVAEKPKTGISALTYDQLVVTRNKLSEQIREAEAVTDAIKAKREKVDAEFLSRFNTQGVTNVKTNHGTPYIIKRESYTVADKDAYMAWIEQNNALDFLEVRCNKTMVDTYKETHGEIPPGLNYSAKLCIGLKRA